MEEKEEEVRLSPRTKAPTQLFKRAKRQHKQRNKKFDNIAVADRLRTVSWSNYSHPTGVVNRFTGPTFLLKQEPCNQNETRKYKCTISFIKKHPKKRQANGLPALMCRLNIGIASSIDYWGYTVFWKKINSNLVKRKFPIKDARIKFNIEFLWCLNFKSLIIYNFLILCTDIG